MPGRWRQLIGLVLFWATFSAHASPASLATDHVRLTWDGATSITDWRIRTGDDEWTSLINHDRHGSPLSQHLRLSVEPDISSSDAPDSGIRLRDQLTPTGQPYWLDYRLSIENTGDESWPGGTTGATFHLAIGPGLGEHPSTDGGIADQLYSFVEPIVSIDGDVAAIDFDEQSLRQSTDLADADFNWAGLHRRYFALLVVPDNIEFSKIEMTRPSANDTGEVPAHLLPQLALRFEIPALKPGEHVERTLRIYSGPKSRDSLVAGSADLTGIVFHNLWNWLRWLCIGLLELLTLIHALIPDWGLSIITLAVLVRLALYPVAKRAMASQQAFVEVQQQIQPQIARIKRDYDGEEESERILALYEHFGVSPLAGLKPLLIVLIQIPVFVALFHVLGQALELRGASFLWMESLSEPDRLFSFGVALPYVGSHFNLLPVLLAATTLMTIKLAPAPAADEQGRRWQNLFLIATAVAFMVVFYPFPSGMVLYWTVANVLHLAQQFLMQRGT